jgi:acyl-coenzyme A synthetase/AMP-(fatty) acid ligase
MRVGLDECEQIVKSKYSLECACVGNDDKMIVYIVDEKYKQLVKDELVEKTKIVASAFEVRVINEIPKNQTGKILYSKLEN